MRLLLTAGSLVILAACASSPRGAAQELTGCYYFERDAAARDLNLPWGVELTPDSLTDAPLLRGQENLRAAVTLLRPGERGDFPFGYWQVISDDVIRLGYPGMGGFTADLSVEGDTLSGLIAGAGDASPSPQLRSVHVRLTRAQCPD